MTWYMTLPTLGKEGVETVKPFGSRIGFTTSSASHCRSGMYGGPIGPMTRQHLFSIDEEVTDKEFLFAAHSGEGEIGSRLRLTQKLIPRARRVNREFWLLAVR